MEVQTFKMSEWHI